MFPRISAVLSCNEVKVLRYSTIVVISSNLACNEEKKNSVSFAHENHGDVSSIKHIVDVRCRLRNSDLLECVVTYIVTNACHGILFLHPCFICIDNNAQCC